MNEIQVASMIQLVGAICFGAIIGWYVYYINRYRKGDIQLGDLVTLIGVLGGGTVLTLFPASTDLFGGYGIGLFFGFFGYFSVLLKMVSVTDNFNIEWFLDGRRKKPGDSWYIPKEVRNTMMPMDVRACVHSLVDEEELEAHLGDGWEFVTALPSRKILIRKEN